MTGQQADREGLTANRDTFHGTAHEKGSAVFEVIISNVRTGRVRRRLFETRAEADGCFDRFLEGKPGAPPRSRRDFRAEVYHRPPAAAPVAAALEAAA